MRGYYKRSLVIDDFAHHPKSVEMTIEGIKIKYPNKNIFVVLEPNSATARSDIFQNEFFLSLKKANKVILAKAQRDTTVKNTKNLDYKRIVDNLCDENIKAFEASNLNLLRNKLDEWLEENDLLLILSNGTCLGLWESSFVKDLT